MTGASRPGGTAAVTARFLLYVLLSLVGGAVLGYGVVRWGMARPDGFIHSLIEDHGAPTIVRRIQTVTAILLAPAMLKAIGWGGFRDLGLAAPASARWRTLGIGYGLGWVCMAVLALASLWVRVRVVGVDAVAHPELRVARMVLITGLGVGLVEEIMARGVLFRALARGATPLLSAVLTSGLFAYVHFAEADPSSFEAGFLPAIRDCVWVDFSPAGVAVETLNLALFGLVLCRMVHHRGHIWMAVGFHASAVGAMKTISVLTDTNHEVPRNPWFGYDSGFLDGRLCTIMLLLVLLLEEFGVFRVRQDQHEEKASAELE